VTVAKLLDSVTADFAVLARRLRDETGALRRFVNVYVDGDEVRRLQGLDTEVASGTARRTVQATRQTLHSSVLIAFRRPVILSRIHTTPIPGAVSWTLPRRITTSS
jgi:hypothetical protein